MASFELAAFRLFSYTLLCLIRKQPSISETMRGGGGAEGDPPTDTLFEEFSGLESRVLGGRMILKRAILLLALLLLLSLFGLPLLAEEAANPFSEARFTISEDPTALVLHVRYGGGMLGSFESLSLYGDGRLVTKKGRVRTVHEEHAEILSVEETQRLLRLAVDHGLAEWDGMAFRAKALEVNAGKPIVVPTDSLRATVLIALETYDRGAYHRQNLEQKISFEAPQFVRQHYPEMREVTGIALLIDELRSKLAAAREVAK